DAMPLLAEAAAPRTAGDVEEVQTALRAARSALRVACRAAAPGAPVAALVAGFAASMSGFGAGFPLGEGLVWRTGPGFVRLPATTALAAGDVIALELAPVVGGFRATRALVVTDGSPRWLEEAP